MKQLYWWYEETDDEAEANLYKTIFQLVNAELRTRGLQVSWNYSGLVTTRAGQVVEKSAADLREKGKAPHPGEPTVQSPNPAGT